MDVKPNLVMRQRDGIRLLLDEAAGERGLIVAFTDRNGGASEPPYHSLNLALRVGDDRQPVIENRRRVAAAAGFDVDRLTLARQVHGADAIEVTGDGGGIAGEADVLVLRGPGAVLGILTADCAPVLLWGERGLAVAHAGWRGLVAGAVETAVKEVEPVHAAWVGPSIHACCYEVGPEVVRAFEDAGLPVAAPYRVDPGRAATFALHRAGAENVGASDICTSCDHDFFSYRRDGATGRQAGVIGWR